LLLHQGVKFGVQIIQHVKDRVGRACRRQRCKFNNVGEQDGACSSKELVVVVHDVQREREREWHSSKWHSRKWHLNRHGQWDSKRQRQQWVARETAIGMGREMVNHISKKAEKTTEHELNPQRRYIIYAKKAEKTRQHALNPQRVNRSC
jgi:hypothetical protein